MLLLEQLVLLLDELREGGLADGVYETTILEIRTVFALVSFSWAVLYCSLRLMFSSWRPSIFCLISSGTSLPEREARRSLG